MIGTSRPPVQHSSPHPDTVVRLADLRHQLRRRVLRELHRCSHHVGLDGEAVMLTDELADQVELIAGGWR